MGVLIGVILVFLAWSVAVAAIALLGMPAATVGAATSTRCDVLRRGIWWGLLLVAIYALLVNIAVPLQSVPAALLLLVLIGVLGSVGLRSLKRHARGARVRLALPWRLLLMAVVLASGYLALAALGPVTNYDSGLYHLGAIRYAAEYPTIPGLANLYFPLGYGNAEFPLAALMGNTGWADQGFRLLNGLIMVLVALDLGIRCVTDDRRPGRFILTVGLITSWVPLVALSDYWVTSPTQDSSLWIITTATIAYLADTIAGRDNWRSDAAVATVLGILMVLLRPTMVMFTFALILVVLALAWTRRTDRTRERSRSVLVVFGVTGAAVLAAAVRDAVLSGWLGYPLAVLPLDVSWREPNPDQYRSAILGFHRDPSNMWNAAEGWAWVGPWLSRLPAQWEFYEFGALFLAAVIVLIVGILQGVMRGSWRSMCLLLAPILIGLLTWWAFSPPSFRFAWGLVFGLPVGIIGWVWARASLQIPRGYAKFSRVAVTGSATVLLLVTLFSAFARFDWKSLTSTTQWSAGISVTVPVAPIARVEARHVTLASGLEVISPVGSEQCWTLWPMCTPSISPNVQLRGTGVGDGFLPD